MAAAMKTTRQIVRSVFFVFRQSAETMTPPTASTKSKTAIPSVMTFPPF